MDDGAGGKCSHRAHLEAAARGGDIESRAILEAHPKTPPASGAYLWKWWLDLGTTARGAGGFSVAPLTLESIERWERRRGISLDPWEERVIFQLDQSWRRSLAKKDDEPEGEAHE